MKVGDTVIVISTNVEGTIIGFAKGVWIVEFPNGGTSAYPSNKLKIKK